VEASVILKILSAREANSPKSSVRVDKTVCTLLGNLCSQIVFKSSVPTLLLPNLGILRSRLGGFESPILESDKRFLSLRDVRDITLDIQRLLRDNRRDNPTGSIRTRPTPIVTGSRIARTATFTSSNAQTIEKEEK